MSRTVHTTHISSGHKNKKPLGAVQKGTLRATRLAPQRCCWFDGFFKPIKARAGRAQTEARGRHHVLADAGRPRIRFSVAHEAPRRQGAHERREFAGRRGAAVGTGGSGPQGAELGEKEKEQYQKQVKKLKLEKY